MTKLNQKRKASPRPKAITWHGKRKGRGEFKVFGNPGVVNLNNPQNTPD
jgi:hypothetical protein